MSENTEETLIEQYALKRLGVEIDDQQILYDIKFKLLEYLEPEWAAEINQTEDNQKRL